MKNNNKLIIAVTILIAIALCPDVSIARDLGSAANSAVSTAKTIARSLSVFGLLVGGIMMQLPGLSHFGRTTLGAGIIGCVCSFGGPSLVTFFESVFGNV